MRQEFRVQFYSSHTDTERWHSFPTTSQEIQKLVSDLGGEGNDYDILDGLFSNKVLSSILECGDDFNELNYLAVKLNNLDDHGLNIFSAALKHQRCHDIKKAINIIENLGCFDLQPAHNVVQYGKFLADLGADESGAAIERIAHSEYEYNIKLTEYITRLEQFCDYHAYGRSIAAEEGGVFTDFGYVTKTSELREVYKGVEDIPQEYRVHESHKYMRLENTDLSALLTKIHALGGDRYFRDLQYNLNKLRNKTSAQYLMLMTKNSIHITEAAHVYRKDTDSNKIWTDIPNNAEVRAFSLYVTDNQEAIIGDFMEISFSAQKKDIADNCIYPSTITVSSRDGDERTFTARQWDSMQLIEKDSYPKRIRHFEPEHLQGVLRNLEERDSINHQNSHCVDEGDFLSDLNDSYMEACENPQPDMLRLPKGIANDILLKTVIGVYRLLPDGPEKLRLMDSVKSSGLNYADYCEFAIKKDALPELGIWAKSKSEELVRPQRNNHTRDKGLEM